MSTTSRDPDETAQGQTDWRSLLVDDEDGLRALLRSARRIAVIGAKGDDRSGEAAHFVPAYLQRAGYEIVPVNPTLDRALGVPAVGSIRLVAGADLVNVFRRPDAVLGHALEVLALPPADRPSTFWMQAGIRNDEAARLLAEAGIRVVQDRCIMVDHRRLVGPAG